MRTASCLLLKDDPRGSVTDLFTRLNEIFLRNCSVTVQIQLLNKTDSLINHI